jgi:hypothetical protein
MAAKKDKITEKQVKEWIERAVKKFENMDCREKKGIRKHTSSGGAVWFLGFIGAAYYYLQGAATFGAAVVGLLKAIVWPAFLAYHSLKFLNI